MERNPRNVRFHDLRKVCDRYFGEPRQSGSHLFYKTPWQGKLLVNIQPIREMAKAYWCGRCSRQSTNWRR